MAMMKVSLGPVDSMDQDQPGSVPAELIAADGGVRSFSLEFGDEKQLSKVDSGLYTVRAFLPSGSVLTTGVEVSDETPNKVSLRPPASSHGWLAWETVMGDTPDEADYLEETTPSRPAVWLRLWRPVHRDGTYEWKPLPWPHSKLNSDMRTWKLSMPLEYRQPGVLQIGGPSLPTRSMVLPPGNEGRVILRPVGEGRIEATIGTERRHLDGLLRYLHAGDSASLRGFEEDTAELAEDMLYHKMSNAFGSVIGGYVLLALNAFERMHSWTGNLAERFPEMSDGAIVHGSRLLREHAAVPWDEVRSWFLEATVRPTPILTYGVNLLHRGLRLLVKRYPDDASLVRALEKSEVLSAALLPDSIYTTFLGPDPNQPDPVWDTSSAVAEEGVQWLPEAATKRAAENMWVELPMASGPPKTEYSGFVREVVVVESRPEGWQVVGPQSTEQLNTRAEAVAIGRKRASDVKPARLVVERTDGSTQYVRNV